MLSIYDYLVIGVYFGFMIAIGALFRKLNRDTSDYFRGSGKVLWWIVGATAFMTQFTAWTFTGGASKAYDNGAPILVLYLANALGFFANYLGTAARLRRMRVITMFEGIRQRWSKGNEQFFTWVQLPVGILGAGIGLNGLGVILSAVFGLDMSTTMLFAGVVVIFMATLGGSWAATVGDFVQMLLLMALSCVTAFLALREVGGVAGFLEKLPAGSFVWGNVARPEILWLWIVAWLLQQGIGCNNMNNGYRYLCAKDDTHARRGALLAAILMLVGPILWFLPPMVARILYPDLTVIPTLAPLGARASEGAYLAIGITTMPHGMLGLMVTGLFAATISGMDTGLNKNTGIFIRSFYLRIVRPQAGERELVIAGKIATVVFGGLTVLGAFMFKSMSGFSLFNMMQQFFSLVGMPLALPLLWGLFFRRTPPWSGWSTTLVCLFVSLVVGNLTTLFGPDAYEKVLGLGAPLEPWERSDTMVVFTVISNVLIGTLWFFGTSFWYRRQPAAYRASVEAFFTHLRTPVDFRQEHGESADQSQLRKLGGLCLAYGGFVLLLALIPNPLIGRCCFVFVALAIGGVGAMLFRASSQAQTIRGVTY